MNLCYRLTGNCPSGTVTAAAGAQDCKDPVSLCDACLAAIGNPAIDCRRCAKAKAACAVAQCQRVTVLDVNCIEPGCHNKIACCDHHIANRCDAHASGACTCKAAATLSLTCGETACASEASGCPECYGPPLFLDPRCATHDGCAVCASRTLTRYVTCQPCGRAFLACTTCRSGRRARSNTTRAQARQMSINGGVCPLCDKNATAGFATFVEAQRMPPVVYVEAATTFCSKVVPVEDEWRIPVQHADGLARQMNEIAKQNAIRHKNKERGFEDKSFDMDLETVETCLCVTIMRETKDKEHWIWIVVTHNADRNTDLGTPFRRVIYDLRAYVMGPKFADVRQWYFTRGATRIVFAAPQAHPMLFHYRRKTTVSDWVILDADSIEKALQRDVWASGLFQGSTRKQQKQANDFDEDISDVSDSETEERKSLKREARWLYKKVLEQTYAKKKLRSEVVQQEAQQDDDEAFEAVDVEDVEDDEDGNDEEVALTTSSKRETAVERAARRFGEPRGYHLRTGDQGTVFIGKDNKELVNLHHAEVRGGAFAALLGAQILGIAATKGCCPKCQKTFEGQLHLVCFDRQQQDRYNEFRHTRAKNNARIPTIDQVLATQQLTRTAVGGGGMCFFHSAATILGGNAMALRQGLGTWLKTANDLQLNQLFALQQGDIAQRLGCNTLLEYAAHLETGNDTWGYSVTVAALAKWKTLRLVVLLWNEEGVDEQTSPIGRISRTDVYGPQNGTPACVINTRPRFAADHFEPVTGANLLAATQQVDSYYARQY